MLITFEGIDGSGKTYLSKKLNAFLREKGFNVLYFSSLGYKKFGKFTNNYIKEKTTYDILAHFFLSNANSRVLVNNFIEPARDNNDIIILDRYYHSAIAYTAPFNINITWLESVCSVLTKPDLIFYCECNLETALNRKKGKINNIERGFNNDENISKPFLEYQGKVRDFYQKTLFNQNNLFVINTDQDRFENQQFVNQTSLDEIYKLR